MSTYTASPFANRRHFEVAVGAWDPMGPPPAGLPANAINLLDPALSASSSFPVQSVPLPARSYIEYATAAYPPETYFTRSSDDHVVEIEYQLGSVADPTLVTGGFSNLIELNGSLNYLAPLEMPDLVLTIGLNTFDVATFGGLAPGGQAIISIVVAVLPQPTIERISP